MQDLQDTQVREGDNAVFTCEVSHEDVKGEWFRDREKIKVSSTVKIRQEGGVHAAPRVLWCWEGVNSSKGSLCGQSMRSLPLPANAAHHYPLEPATLSAGTRHFLLLCCVRPEDTGLICFTAGTAAVSEASLRVEGTSVGVRGLAGLQHHNWVYQRSSDNGSPLTPLTARC